jgi:signal peptide peptidase SppA
MILTSLKSDSLKPWLCKHDAIVALQNAVKEIPMNLFFNDPQDPQDPDETTEAENAEAMDNLVDGVLVIPVNGVLVQDCTDLEAAILGLQSYEEIRELVDFAKTSDQVQAAVLCINSPGGEAANCFETASMIRELAEIKPTIAFVSGLCASAAYFLACGAELIYCQPSSEIGCVGTLLGWYDSSKQLEAAGVKMDLIKSGDYKGIMPEIPLTESHRKMLQHTVDLHGAMFRDFVKAARPQIDVANLQGQDFVGVEAVDLGFADSLANRLEVAIADALKMTK